MKRGCTRRSFRASGDAIRPSFTSLSSSCPYASVLKLSSQRLLGVLEGARGGEAWDTEALASIVVGLGIFASATSGWLESIEINQLLATDAGFAAVDLSCFVRR